MNINLNWSAPEYAIWFGSGFAAYYLRYGNQWQGNEIRLCYNVFFGILNLIGWCIEWVWAVLPGIGLFMSLFIVAILLFTFGRFGPKQYRIF